jgi:hypothetical protein
MAFSNWPQLLVERTLFRDTSLQVHRLGEMQMLVDNRAGDAGSIITCIASPMYRKLLAMVSLPTSLTLLDIGANAGGFTLLVRSQGHAIEKLVCAEMNPNTFQRLRFNVMTNVGLHAKPVNCALGPVMGDSHLDQAAREIESERTAEATFTRSHK